MLDSKVTGVTGASTMQSHVDPRPSQLVRYSSDVTWTEEPEEEGRGESEASVLGGGSKFLGRGRTTVSYTHLTLPTICSV
eukprot:1073692-Rhodomonas_salina.1